MNIAFITPSLSNSGPIIVVQDLCFGLIAMGHTCKVFYFDDIVELDMPCDTERIGFFRKFDFATWDVVHSHMLRPDLWVWLHRPWFGKCNQKFVTTIHQDIKETLSFDYGKIVGFAIGKLWRLSIKRFDKIVVLTSKHKESIKEVKSSKIVVVYNGRRIDVSLDIDTQDIVPITELKQKYSIVLGTTSIMTRRKGLEQVILSLLYLPQCAYVAVGDGVEKQALQELAKNIGVADRCLWLGRKDRGYRYTRYFDIFLIVSRSEGFPLALIEAAAFGKPIVCSDIPIFKSIVNESQVSFAPLDNPELLAQIINDLYNNKDEKSETVSYFYNSYLTREKMCQSYENIYLEK